MVIKNSLQSQAYDTLKEQILSNILTPGVLYSETKISKELGISRTPMREALQCLSQDGYITIIPSRGFKIRQLSKESMRESIQIRCAIEGFCVHLIASQPSEKRCQKLLKDMERSLARQKKALASPARTEFIFLVFLPNVLSFGWNRREISSLCVYPYTILNPHSIKCFTVSVMASLNRVSKGASNSQISLVSLVKFLPSMRTTK